MRTRISRYAIFLRVVESESFTRAAQQMGYSQSAVSQAVKALEGELGCTLLERRKGEAALTKDGRQYLPYLRAIALDEEALLARQREMEGLENATVTIGTFTSVSRNLLPPLMQEFRTRYPDVRFVLRQGEYTSIADWLHSGACDLGFTNQTSASAAGLEVVPLFRDQMMAVLPESHPLAEGDARGPVADVPVIASAKARTTGASGMAGTVRAAAGTADAVTLAQLTDQTLIQLDEGEQSVAMDAFSHAGLHPQVSYDVTDDYSILAMVRRGLGVSILYELMLSGFGQGVVVRPIAERPERTISIACKRSETLPIAARRFSQFIVERLRTEP